MPARRGRIGGCGALPSGRSAYVQSRTNAGEPTRSWHKARAASPHGTLVRAAVEELKANLKAELLATPSTMPPKQ
jgi:hypothetical protein